MEFWGPARSEHLEAPWEPCGAPEWRLVGSREPRLQPSGVQITTGNQKY